MKGDLRKIIKEVGYRSFLWASENKLLVSSA
jgi:hypothetical protein